ncbi:MAG: cupin domain-containing protein [Chitinophagaceae bacterium]|nr:MAG: cupin domain-containing protein [Chitinophagaceae bacterium]
MEIIKDIPVRELVPGINGYYRHGAAMTLGLVLIDKGTSLPMHQHPHEQITYMIKGELEMQIGDETVLLTPGSVQVIPSNVLHGATAHSDCELIDVFNPIREDYR